MLVKQQEITSSGVRISLVNKGKEIARAFLYVLTNDLHPEPFGLLEDLFVQEKNPGKGYGKQLVQEVITEARKRGCYKLIGTSRYEREPVHKFYQDLGFLDYGKEFRMDLKVH